MNECFRKHNALIKQMLDAEFVHEWYINLIVNIFLSKLSFTKRMCIPNGICILSLPDFQNIGISLSEALGGISSFPSLYHQGHSK